MEHIEKKMTRLDATGTPADRLGQRLNDCLFRGGTERRRSPRRPSPARLRGVREHAGPEDILGRSSDLGQIDANRAQRACVLVVKGLLVRAVEQLENA